MSELSSRHKNMAAPMESIELTDRAQRPVNDEDIESGETALGSADDPQDLPPLESLPVTRPDGLLELPEAYCKEKFACAFSTGKKWRILCVIFIIQSSMNFNASVYGNAVPGMSQRFDLSPMMARVGQMIFLVAYGFGSELWAPWSEEYGRRDLLALSLLFVSVWSIPCAVAHNYATIIVFRLLGGLSSAGGSVTLGMVADMYDVEDHQYALNFIVLSSCGGSAIGPIIGAFIERYLDWSWVFWMQSIFGFIALIIHLSTVPETRKVTIMDEEARFLRKKDQGKYGHIAGPSQLAPGMDRKQVVTIWLRPFAMFIKEPIVLCLSLLSGFSDALIFLFIDSFHKVFKKWNFGTIQMGLTFVPIVIGYLVCFVSYYYPIGKFIKVREQNPMKLQPEARLWWLCIIAPWLILGLLGFAICSFGPPVFHWIAPQIFAFLIAIANYAIYMGTIDYMVLSYGEYSASATGGNALARDVLAGVSAMVSTPLYQTIGDGKWQLVAPGLILAGLSFGITVPLYWIYQHGRTMREKSVFACKIAADRETTVSRGGTLANPIEQAEIHRRVRSTVKEGLPPRASADGAIHDVTSTANAPQG